MIPKIIDSKTLDLLYNLQNDFDISFEVKNIDYCNLIQKDKKAIIYYNPKIVNSESIAHELLHLWLSRYNYSIGNYLYLYAKEDKKLSTIFNKFLCDYIDNCCDHLKMYPKFLSMGYSPKEFLKNGLELKVKILEVKKINLKFLGLYKSKSVNLFIGYIFSILADHIKENNYDEHHSLLIQKEKELYSIIVTFWAKWKVFDIENLDAFHNSDLELTDSLIEGITEWANDKTFI